MIFTTAVVVLGAVVALWYLSTYNGLVGARNATDQSWSNVDVELKRRFDLIANLVETTKGYAQHENQVLAHIAALRGGTGGFTSAATANATEQETKQLVGRLLAVAEAYPDLKASEQFQSLHHDLADTENRIAERREAYNQTVNLYRTLCQSVPSNVVAEVHRFEPREFFRAPDEVASAPRVVLT
jgi:LemA protein